MTSTDCYSCLSSKWRATGRFNENRFGRRRAELICEACGYSFSSGKPDAIAAGEQAQAQGGYQPPQPVESQPVVYRQPADLASVSGLANDWKSRQAGEE